MRKLLNQAATTVSLEKDLVKELKQMAERFKSVDKQPEEELLDDQSRFILGKFLLFLGNSWKICVFNGSSLDMLVTNHQKKNVNQRNAEKLKYKTVFIY